MICQVCKEDHRTLVNKKWCDRSELEIEKDYLKAENARLREALEDIVHCIYGSEATFRWVEKKAREALKGGE